MKRIVLGWLVLLSGLAFAPANPASAADLGTVRIFDGAISPSVLSSAVVGDTFSISVEGAYSVTVRVVDGTGSVTGAVSGSCAGHGCYVTPYNSQVFTINALGNLTIMDTGGTVLGAIQLGSSTDDSEQPEQPQPKRNSVRFDPNGGQCVVDGETLTEPWTRRTDRDWVRMPVDGFCTRDGHLLLGWLPTEGDLVAVGERASSATDYVAQWEKLPTPPTPRLDVEVSGQGVVYTVDAGIQCGEFFFFVPQKLTKCGLDGAAIRTLYAFPVWGQSFLGWGGACANTPITAACTVSVTGSTTAVARFGLVNLTVDKQGSGTVSEFTFSTPRIDCGATCSAGLLKDSSILLVAAPAPGQYFVEWAGACAGTPSTSACSLTVANDTKATAVFAAGNRLVVDIAPREGNDGVVWSVPYGLICGGVFELCDVTFPSTVSEFTLFAVNGRDHRFSGWGGACNGTATTSACSVSFATGSKERRVTVSYEELAWVPVATFDEPIYGMSRDGRTVLTGSLSTTRVLRENSRTGEWKTILEISLPAARSRLSGDGNTVVTCGDDSGFSLPVVVRRWNETSSTWQQVGAPINGTDSCPDVVSDNGSVLATAANIYDWRAASGSWVKRSTPKAQFLEAVNRQGNVAVFATLSPGWEFSYAMYRWDPDTSTWTRLEAFEGISSIDRISDDGRFLFDFFTGGDLVYDTSLKSWTFAIPDGVLVGGSVRGDAFSVLEVYRGDGAILPQSIGVSVRRWDPTTSRWVQYGRAIGVGLLEAVSLAYGLPYASLSDESPGRITIDKTIYEWSFPRR